MKIFIDPFFRSIYERNNLVLVDVGASGGFAPNWKPAAKYLRVIGFEPDEREYKNLASKSEDKIRYLNIALHGLQGEVDFFLTRKQQASSIYRPNRSLVDQFPESSRFDILKTVKLKTDTLDHQFQINNIQDADFLKVDTQGSELAIMQGAKKTIQEQIIGIEVEVEFAMLYEGQPLFTDVDMFLRQQGFQLMDLSSYFWKRSGGELLGKQRGQIICADALYMRTKESFELLIGSIDGQELKKAKILKIMAISALYGYFDYAAFIFEGLKNHFTKEEQDEIKRWFESSRGPCYLLPSFRGKGKLARISYSISEFLRTVYHNWATVERDLGNS